MIQITLTAIVFLFLFIISLIDLRTKRVPAFLTTSIIFAVALVNMVDLNFGILHLAFGVLAFIFAYLIYELNFIGGVADIKVIVIIGMMIAQLSTFFIFMITIMIFGIAYKIVWRYVLKKPEGSEVPFIISLWAVYCVLWITGGLI